MVLVSWTNPKVWLTIPAGYLAANFTGNLPVDVLIFFFIGSPLFLAGVFIWGTIGRQGAKLAREKIGYFNAALLAAFGCYLLYQGVGLLRVG
jgi:threonine/homoserine/homoserine lactone efflux protein